MLTKEQLEQRMNAEWLATQPAERQAGLLLELFIARTSKSRSEFAKDVSCSERTIQDWILGRPPVLDRMPDIQRALMLSDAELARLNQLADPFRAPSDRMDGLKPEWLGAQSPDKQAGLLLRAYRVRRYKTQMQFAEDLGIARNTLGMIEGGVSAIPLDRMLDIQRILKLENEDMVHLNRLADPFRAPSDRMDGLDAEWLQSQPADKQAGLLLRAYRVRGYRTLGQLAEDLGIGPHALGMIERGVSPVPLDAMVRIRHKLSLSPEDMKRLNVLAYVLRLDIDKPKALLEPEWFDGLPDREKAGQMLRSYRVEAYQALKQAVQTLPDVSCEMWSRWEVGTSSIPSNKMPDIQRVLTLTDQQVRNLQALMALRRDGRFTLRVEESRRNNGWRLGDKD